jgi:hypothetical protein
MTTNLDFRSQPSDAPVAVALRFRQPGMHDIEMELSIDDELPGGEDWAGNVTALADTIAGLVTGVYCVYTEPRTESHLRGYQAGLISANASRVDD